ncbi:hypothetical protein NPIL_674851 [Nephila pilipes]|uniref:Uncharacterized protein n=1 Tax=Nephila pilipes TaxID=299642 RepID=A0A8X6QGU5_NEPPI|nr:hypothetical protein NPIL_674851 [Nephila pilipes]
MKESCANEKRNPDIVKEVFYSDLTAQSTTKIQFSNSPAFVCEPMPSICERHRLSDFSMPPTRKLRIPARERCFLRDE